MRALCLSGDGAGDARVTTVRVRPRGAVEADLPAVTLRGYRLAWQATDRQGPVVAGRLLDLPTLRPGDEPWTGQGDLEWRRCRGRGTGQPLSPTGFEVAVTGRALAAPSAPALREAVVAVDGVRAAFGPVPAADSYRLEVVADGRTHTAVTCRNDVLEVAGLPGGMARIRVVRGQAGGENGSPWHAVELPGSGGHLPPRVPAVIPTPGGVVLGWSGSAADDGYDIEVTDARTDAVVRAYRTSLRGASRVEELDPGHRYVLRIRGVRGGVAGAWPRPVR